MFKISSADEEKETYEKFGARKKFNGKKYKNKKDSSERNKAVKNKLRSRLDQLSQEDDEEEKDDRE